ncbi:MAG: winged helix-turn-helix transcriptional regulator [Planctomycetes bacterium]|nr:winged helix-turn-helix transcriptional regulator [Planctomycetota bacterium]
MTADDTRVRAGLLFRAFSDPTRLRILQFLQGGELCVGDLATLLRVPQAKTSRHLGYLRRAGVVRAREDGLWSFYSLARPRKPLHRLLVRCLDEIPRPTSDARREIALRMTGGCCP